MNGTVDQDQALLHERRRDRDETSRTIRTRGGRRYRGGKGGLPGYPNTSSAAK